MSVVGNTFSNSSAQQIVLGDAIGRVTGGRFGTIHENNGQAQDHVLADGQDLHETSPEERAQQVAQLARTFSQQSQRAPPQSPHNRRGSLYRTLTGQSNVDHAKLFEYEAGSDLDPYSASFDAKKWTKSMAQMSRNNLPARSAGIAYRNLSVHGYGSDAGASVGLSSKSAQGLTRQITKRRFRTCQSPGPARLWILCLVESDEFRS